jgi:hypothetical protein
MASAPESPETYTPHLPLIYVSYSRRDRKLVEQILAVARPLIPQAEFFYDVLIAPGENFSDTLAARLTEASIVLFFLSPDSLNSRYCQREIEAAISQPGKRLIPIVLRPCDWLGTPLSKFFALPRDAKPVTTWKNREEAYLNVAQGILTVVAAPESAPSERAPRDAEVRGSVSESPPPATESAPRVSEKKWQRPLPVGEERLHLAYLAVLELPELWGVLESLDESALAGLGAQLQLAPDEDVLQALRSRRPGLEPPPLWTAWISALYPSKIGKSQGSQ